MSVYRISGTISFAIISLCVGIATKVASLSSLPDFPLLPHITAKIVKTFHLVISGARTSFRGRAAEHLQKERQAATFLLSTSVGEQHLRDNSSVSSFALSAFTETTLIAEKMSTL
jgi:hypothetical protein